MPGGMITWFPASANGPDGFVFGVDRNGHSRRMCMQGCCRRLLPLRARVRLWLWRNVASLQLWRLF